MHFHSFGYYAYINAHTASGSAASGRGRSSGQGQCHVTRRGYPLYRVPLVFWVIMRIYRQTERQADRQTALNILPTPTDSVGMGNNNNNLNERSPCCCRPGRLVAERRPGWLAAELTERSPYCCRPWRWLPTPKIHSKIQLKKSFPWGWRSALSWRYAAEGQMEGSNDGSCRRHQVSPSGNATAVCSLPGTTSV